MSWDLVVGQQEAVRRLEAAVVRLVRRVQAVGHRAVPVQRDAGRLASPAAGRRTHLDLPGAVANHAGQMAEAAALIAPAFEKSIRDGATDARPEIWTDWAGFEEAIAGYEAAARNLATAASEGNPGQIGSAMRALGKSCGSCHKPFRKPKEESYKNR